VEWNSHTRTCNIKHDMRTPPRLGADRLLPFAPAAKRTLEVFGAPMQLVLLPQRRGRADRPGTGRPAFRTSPVPRILATESLWTDDTFAMTPNRYPFAVEHAILWPRHPQREPDMNLWLAMVSWSLAHNGTALLNTVGGAASIAWAHAHLTPERLDFLENLPEQPLSFNLIELEADTTLVAKRTPFFLLGVRGPAVGIAQALVKLAACRLTAAWNVIVCGGAAWMIPRVLEIPASGFPYALGAAELWGRCCYLEETAFESATANGLELALTSAGTSASGLEEP
jgi:hypothetical protein